MDAGTNNQVLDDHDDLVTSKASHGFGVQLVQETSE